MSKQRGIGFLGVLIWGAVLGGAYYGLSVAPVFFDNMGFKQDARAVCNDWISRMVTDPKELDRRMHVKAHDIGIDPKDFKVTIEASEASVSISCEYRRVWKLLFTDKAYARRFAWTVTQKR
jgi:hypothetical protein